MSNGSAEGNTSIRFGTSGLRGVVGVDITPDTCHSVGRAVATGLVPGARVCIARDTRLTGEQVRDWTVNGLLSSGVDVVDFGIAPTPVLAGLTRAGDFSAGVMLTASHNPPEYNGIKLFDSAGCGFSREQEERIEQVCDDGRFTCGSGTLERDKTALKRYLATIPADLARKAAQSGIPLMVDPGNGAASMFVRAVFQKLGLEVIAVNDTSDGMFPGRGAEPSASTLVGTSQALCDSTSDIAACFDGDADRVLFCDRDGFIGLDEMVAFVAHNRVQETERFSLATTVETGLLPQYALERIDATVIRGRVGDVAVAHLTRQEDAALGCESVGVYIFPELGLYPDSIVATLHVLAAAGEAPAIRRFLGGLPTVHLVKRKIPCAWPLMHRVMERVLDDLPQALGWGAAAVVNTIDGCRLETPDAWLLVRASGTEPVVRITSESVSKADADRAAGRAESVVSLLIEQAPKGGQPGGTR